MRGMLGLARSDGGARVPNPSSACMQVRSFSASFGWGASPRLATHLSPSQHTSPLPNRGALSCPQSGYRSYPSRGEEGEDKVEQEGEGER